MSIEYKVERFSKPGKGFPQVPQLDSDGKPVVDKDNKPVIGNEQYTCNQLTDESIDSSSVELFITDVMAAVDGDLKLAASMFREGWNRNTRLSAAGLDEYQKAAKGVIKLGLPWTKGLSVDQVAEKLKAMNGQLAKDQGGERILPLNSEVTGMLMIERDKGTAVEGYIVWEFNPNKNEWDFVKRFNSLNAAINAFPNAVYDETLN